MKTDAREANEMAADVKTGWLPIETVPEGRHVLFYFPNGDRGVGGMEAATIYDRDELDCGWSHGGANSGSDLGFCEKPTH
jgi:hypothetical protein